MPFEILLQIGNETKTVNIQRVKNYEIRADEESKHSGGHILIKHENDDIKVFKLQNVISYYVYNNE